MPAVEERTPVPRRVRRWDGPVMLATTIVVLVPLLVALVDVLGRRITPVGDIALLDLRTRDVFTGATPLLGAYSRFGWSHPGPVGFWLLAPFSVLGGGSASSMYAGVIVVLAAGVAWSAWLAYRLGGLFLGLGALLVQALTFVGLHESVPWYRPWNPTLAVPFFLVFVLAVWSVGLGRVRDLPTAAASGSLLVLLHVGYLPLVGVGAAWVLVGVIRAQRAGASVRAPLLLALAISAVLWAPAVFEQIRQGADGNLVLIARSAFGARLPHMTQVNVDPVGLRTAAGVLADEFRFVPAWLGGPAYPSGAPGGFAAPAGLGWLLVPLGLWIAATVVVRRHPDRRSAHALWLLGLLAVTALLGLGQVRGDLTDYAFYWRVPLAVLLVVVPIGVLARSLRPEGGRGRQVLTIALVGGLVAATVATTAWVTDGDPAQDAVNPIVADLARQVPQSARNRGPIRFIQTGDLGLYAGVAVGLFDDLDRRGFPVGLTRRFAEAYVQGEHVSSRPGGRTWLVAQGRNVSELLGRPGVRLLAESSPLSRTDELRLRRLQRRLSAQLRDAGRADLLDRLDLPLPQGLPGVGNVRAAEVRELTRLQRRVGGARRYALFEVAPAAVSDVVTW